jgi:hypothetical protein
LKQISHAYIEKSVNYSKLPTSQEYNLNASTLGKELQQGVMMGMPHDPIVFH